MATANQKKVRTITKRVQARNPSMKPQSARQQARTILRKRKGLTTTPKSAAKKQGPADIPMSSEAKAARQALIAADLVGMEASRQRTTSLAKGAYGGPQLRSAGGDRERYRVGRPKADAGYGSNRARAKKRAKIGKTKPGTPARMLKKAGGNAKDLRLFRRLGIIDRRRIVRRTRQGANIRKLVHARFQR